MTNDYNRTTVIPEYPFWAASKPEYVFGAPSERYLDISKGEAGRICDALPKETAAADELFATGAIVRNGLEHALSRDIAPEQIRDTIGALLRSRGPSHEIKIATVAVALHHWFNQEIAA